MNVRFYVLVIRCLLAVLLVCWLLIADVPHIWCTRKATLLQWAMQFMKHFAWGVDVISFCSLLISPLLYYVSDVRPEHDRTVFNHPLPFVATQSWEVATIGGLCEAVVPLEEGHKVHSRRSATSGPRTEVHFMHAYLHNTRMYTRVLIRVRKYISFPPTPSGRNNFFKIL